MPHSVSVPALGRIVLALAALAAGGAGSHMAWTAYRADRLVATAQADLAWGRLEAARDTLTRAVAIAPEDSGTLASLAAVHESIARFRNDDASAERAVAALRAAIDVDPLHASHHAALGSALLTAGNPDAASAAYTRALELDPNSTLLLASLARVREEQGRFAEAAELYRRALDILPTTGIRMRLAQIENR